MARLNPLHQARVNAFIRTPSNPTLTPITFLIDTGASYMCLLPSDVKRLGIPYAELKPSPSLLTTAIGEVHPRLLDRVNIYLTVLEGDTEQFLALNFENMRVIPPIEGHHAPVGGTTYSLLGMDVLKHFPRWSFEGEWLFLDTA